MLYRSVLVTMFTVTVLIAQSEMIVLRSRYKSDIGAGFREKALEWMKGFKWNPEEFQVILFQHVPYNSTFSIRCL